MKERLIALAVICVLGFFGCLAAYKYGPIQIFKNKTEAPPGWTPPVAPVNPGVNPPSPPVTPPANPPLKQTPPVQPG